MTRELEGGVLKLCNLSKGVFDEGYGTGYDIGYDEAVLNDIKNLMESTGWGIEKTMEILKIPKDRQESYKKLVVKETATV